MATVVNREAPYSGLANLMAMRGRMGDTELVHMSKPEIKGLASLGELTINPDTGLPEAFKLKSILPTVAGLAAAYFTGGTSLLIPALATDATFTTLAMAATLATVATRAIAAATETHGKALQ